MATRIRIKFMLSTTEVMVSVCSVCFNPCCCCCRRRFVDDFACMPLLNLPVFCRLRGFEMFCCCRVDIWSGDFCETIFAHSHANEGEKRDKVSETQNCETRIQCPTEFSIFRTGPASSISALAYTQTHLLAQFDCDCSCKCCCCCCCFSASPSPPPSSSSAPLLLLLLVAIARCCGRCCWLLR